MMTELRPHFTKPIERNLLHCVKDYFAYKVTFKKASYDIGLVAITRHPPQSPSLNNLFTVV